MAKLYRSNGIIEDVTPKNGNDFSLEEMQAMVGGYIETLSLNDGKWIVVNEEGKLNNLPLNFQATKIIRDCGYADYIVGDALICNNGEIN